MASFLDELVEIFPAKELHRDEDLVLVVSQVVDGDDVLVAERGHHPRFAKEPLDRLGFRIVADRMRLERDLTVENGVEGAIDHPHTALTDSL